jgi:hypothetical protein
LVVDEFIRGFNRYMIGGGFTVDPYTFFRVILGFSKEQAEQVIKNLERDDENA